MKQFVLTAFILINMIVTSSFAAMKDGQTATSGIEKEVLKTLKASILKNADWAMKQRPVTVTAESSLRSAGGKHDFYSEGDYWWPDAQNPEGPYIQKDGMTNPENFVAHRLAMIRFSKIIGALASAYKLTGDQKYVKQAMLHLQAWFINEGTMMNPNLKYAQAIKGRFTGRGIGIIDTIQLMEVAQGIIVMQKAMEPGVLSETRKWFAQYLTWLMTHQYGKDEMNAQNNHGTCFTMQVASFAKLCNDDKLLDFCRDRYKNVLLPNQMAVDGSFPRELARTKPYGYSIFNLDAMTTLCQILSTKADNLWDFQTADGRSIKKGIEYLYPFVADKSKWPLKPDVMYWDNWPVAQPFLVFGASVYEKTDWLNIWAKLDHDPKVEEVIRNLPVRNPLIWLN
ncbi:MAG: alginate lyase family protein [Candidatus Pedobacter colombiensis]|uniref:Alginate lyase family protein n=1 Tax=Candidatus Pedobacter colombiensis TaxID=3121371 RepID=A0AAJ6B4H1_9SPHI|nr:alginate lyase family protein [Pedobacter sp.]WEK17627.1 MAG: alginate lyase family protein [Pedobacter sp.]